MADNHRAQSIYSCRFFSNGLCREGNNCRFRHANPAQDDASTPDLDFINSSYNVACYFFKRGTCKFGDNCHYRHTAEAAGGSSSQRNRSDGSSSSQQAANNAVTPKETKKTEAKGKTPSKWAQAREFVPSGQNEGASSSSSADEESTSASGSSTKEPLSYAKVTCPSSSSSSSTQNPVLEPLCPFAEHSGVCDKPNCTYIHGDICDLCNRPALHPHDEELRKQHTNACVKQHEVDMELSFAIARSKDKSCGVCFETIMEKSTREQRFGILPNCNHCFCLTCIRKWRQAKQFDNKIIRACPECRVASDFVCPSIYWVETKEEKQKLIEDYKIALSTKDCKYFNKGRGKCPFGNKCFYLHALPDGTVTDVGPPIRRRRNADSAVDLIQQMLLWDFLEERQDRWMYIDYEDITPFLSESDDSDWSEYEFTNWD